jgi:hypothetical protein
MHHLHIVFAYFGPETVLPVTSLLTTIAALVLMFGKSMLRLVVYWAGRASFRKRHRQASTGPHFGLGRRRRNTGKAGATGRARQVNE